MTAVRLPSLPVLCLALALSACGREQPPNVLLSAFDTTRAAASSC